MRKTHLIPTLLLVLATSTACEIFEDRSPENLFLKMSGDPGASVQLMMSTEFIAGVNEVGMTEVKVFRSDTVVVELPVDTVISISRYNQFLLEATPLSADTMNVSVRIDVDTRKQLDESGDIFRINPWRYVYVFNQPVTRSVEIII